MKILKLHSNGKPVYVNASNIDMYCFNAENGKVNLIVNSLKGIKLEVDEALYQIQEMFDMGKTETDEKGE